MKMKLASWTNLQSNQHCLQEALMNTHIQDLIQGQRPDLVNVTHVVPHAITFHARYATWYIVTHATRLADTEKCLAPTLKCHNTLTQGTDEISHMLAIDLMKCARVDNPVGTMQETIQCTQVIGWIHTMFQQSHL